MFLKKKNSPPPPLLSSSQYMVVFPAVIHRFQEEQLCIHLSSVTEDVHLAVTLELETQSQTVVEKDVEKPGTFECIGFKVSVAVIAVLSVDALTLTSDNSALLACGPSLPCHGLQTGEKYFPTNSYKMQQLAKQGIFHCINKKLFF